MNKWPKVIWYLLAASFAIVIVFYYYYVPEIPPTVLNDKYGVGPQQYLDVKGLKVHFRDEGNKEEKVPLVLLHGTFSSLYTWDNWTEILKDEHRIIRLDLPGFGLTGPHPSGDYTLETYLLFLEDFLSIMDIDSCVLGGNSLGGEIAWRYALKRPKQVKKLILIGAAGYPVDMKNLPLRQLPLSYLLLRIALLREISVNFASVNVVRNSLEYLYGAPDKVTEDQVRLYYDMTNRLGNREALTERMESFNRPSPYEAIPSIHVPTLVLWGRQDRLIPVENAKKFQRDLPNSVLTIFSTAGHMPMEEIPAVSAKSVEEFLSKY